MKQKQLPPCLRSLRVVGILEAMPNLADVVQVTGVLRHGTTGIEQEKDNAVLFASLPNLLPPAFCLFQGK